MAAVFNTNTDGLPVNPDLQKERDTASFNVKELTRILDGGDDRTKRRKELERLILCDPTFSSKDHLYLDKSGKYENAVLRSVKLVEWKKRHQWSEEDTLVACQQVNISEEALTLHRDMFIPALQRLCNEEQKAKWLPLAMDYKIIGTYAQTELGHGTNLRNLETTATFDPATDEFVMNTPRISSMKWWPGALGKSSNHAVVLAQLIIREKNYGLQPFMVQLRSLNDHEPMPGISVGDIGPKMTINHVDNGFLILNNVRIPRENMLMGNCEVSRSGQFRQLKSDKSNYSTMMYVRVMITRWSYGTLSHGVTIAARYSAVRRQGFLDPTSGEIQVLDYQTQQYKLFPAIAATYALFFTQQVVFAGYNSVLTRLIDGDKETLAEYHCLTSAMKAICSEITCEHLEILRRSLGGHGFLMLAGIPSIALSALTLVTVEGDNTVLYQQVARHLVKQVAVAMSGGRVKGSTSYLGESMENICDLQAETDCRDSKLLLHVFKRMAHRSVYDAAKFLQADLAAGLTQHAAWNKNQVHLVKAAKAHSLMHILNCNMEGLAALHSAASPALLAVLQRLCCLFALYSIDINAGLFMETEAIKPAQMQIVKSVEMKLLSEIRPDAVTLVDAFDVPDDAHKSPLGCYDGNVYERMYAAALAEPMNKTQVHPAYHKYLKGMVKRASSKL